MMAKIGKSLKVDSHMLWYDVARYDVARYDVARYDVVWHNAAKMHGFCSHIQSVPL